MKMDVIAFSEGSGFFTLGIKTLEQARKAIRREWDLDKPFWQERFGVADFNEADVKEARAYYHRKCETYTMETPECWNCGESFRGGGGRKTFIVYF